MLKNCRDKVSKDTSPRFLRTRCSWSQQYSTPSNKTLSKSPPSPVPLPSRTPPPILPANPATPFTVEASLWSLTATIKRSQRIGGESAARLAAFTSFTSTSFAIPNVTPSPPECAASSSRPRRQEHAHRPGHTEGDSLTHRFLQGDERDSFRTWSNEIASRLVRKDTRSQPTFVPRLTTQSSRIPRNLHSENSLIARVEGTFARPEASFCSSSLLPVLPSFAGRTHPTRFFHLSPLAVRAPALVFPLPSPSSPTSPPSRIMLRSTILLSALAAVAQAHMTIWFVHRLPPARLLRVSLNLLSPTGIPRCTESERTLNTSSPVSRRTPSLLTKQTSRTGGSGSSFFPPFLRPLVNVADADRTQGT